MKNLLIGILAFGIGWLAVEGAFYVLRENTAQTPQSPSQLSSQDYIDRATTNCSTNGDGLTEVECRCMYTRTVNTYGVAKTYQMDIEAARDPNYVFPDEILQIATDCMLGESI